MTGVMIPLPLVAVVCTSRDPLQFLGNMQGLIRLFYTVAGYISDGYDLDSFHNFCSSEHIAASDLTDTTGNSSLQVPRCPVWELFTGRFLLWCLASIWLSWQYIFYDVPCLSLSHVT